MLIFTTSILLACQEHGIRRRLGSACKRPRSLEPKEEFRIGTGFARRYPRLSAAVDCMCCPSSSCVSHFFPIGVRLPNGNRRSERIRKKFSPLTRALEPNASRSGSARNKIRVERLPPPDGVRNWKQNIQSLPNIVKRRNRTATKVKKLTRSGKRKEILLYVKRDSRPLALKDGGNFLKIRTRKQKHWNMTNAYHCQRSRVFLRMGTCTNP